MIDLICCWLVKKTTTTRMTNVNGKLSLEDISQYFNLPIAEASSILGVCTSVLKRICRESGIVRWPYRKFLAGKTVDDIRKDAAREKSKELAGLSNIAKQSIDSHKLIPSLSAGLPSTFGNQVMNRTPDLAQEIPKMQQGISVPGNLSQSQGNKILQHVLPGAVQFHQSRHIPTYLDEFKYGFPVNGLSSASIKWWGSSSESGNRTSARKLSTEQEEIQELCDSENEIPSCMMIDDETDHGTDSACITKPSASLLALRKRVLEDTRESLQVGVSRCTSYRLGKRQRLVLVKVFGSSLPDQWKDNFL